MLSGDLVHCLDCGYAKWALVHTAVSPRHPCLHAIQPDSKPPVGGSLSGVGQNLSVVRYA